MIAKFIDRWMVRRMIKGSKEKQTEKKAFSFGDNKINRTSQEIFLQQYFSALICLEKV